MLAPIELYRGCVVRSHDGHDITDMLQTDSHVIRVVGRLPTTDVVDHKSEEQRRVEFDAHKAVRVEAEKLRRRQADLAVRTMQERENTLRREFDAAESAIEMLERDLRRRFDDLSADCGGDDTVKTQLLPRCV